MDIQYLLNISEIVGVNEEWIFWEGGKKERTTLPKIQKIINQAVEDINFYNRAMAEIDHISGEQRAVAAGYYTIDKDVYREESFKLFGMLDIQNELSRKLSHAELIRDQAKKAIKKI